MIRTILQMFVIVSVFLLFSSGTSRAEYEGLLSNDQLTSIIEETSSKVVVVNFWATWCGPCRQEFPTLMSLREKYSKEDLLLVGISVDYNAKAVKFFSQRVGFTYPIYLDGGDIVTAYDVSAIPRMLVFANGTLQASHVGYVPQSTIDSLITSFLTP